MSLNVFFVDAIGNPIYLQLTRDMKFSEAVKKLQIISGMDLTHPQIIFIFNSTIISQNCDKTLSELGIENMSKIIVHSNLYMPAPLNLGYPARLYYFYQPAYQINPLIDQGHGAPCISVENIIKENEIFVTFDYEDDHKLTSTLKLRKNMKFSEAASKYFNEMDIDEEEEKEFKFIKDSQNIDFNKTLDEIGIKNHSRIAVLRPGNICGAGLSIESILEKEVNKGVSTKKSLVKKYMSLSKS